MRFASAWRKAARPAHPKGYTLIELLIVLIIIMLVASIILPAIMASRDTSQRVACSNNLRQLSVGLQTFEAAHARYPGCFAGIRIDSSTKTKVGYSFSPSSQIAAELGEAGLADRIPATLDPEKFDPEWSGLRLPSPLVLRCPSDPQATGSASSYRFCRGTMPSWPRDPGGVFIGFRGISPAEITDGLSHTIFASERPVKVDDGRRVDRQRNVIDVGPGQRAGAAGCLKFNEENPWPAEGSMRQGPVGTPWLSGEWLHSSFYSFFRPNSLRFDCDGSPVIGLAVVSARSNHPRGVNVLMGDGSTHFTRDEIALPLWRAMSTRSSGDPAGGGPL